MFKSIDRQALKYRSDSSAARMRPKRQCPPKKLPKNFAGALYQFSTVRKNTEGTVGLKTTSVTDDVIDWLLPNKMLGGATV